MKYYLIFRTVFNGDDDTNGYQGIEWIEKLVKQGKIVQRRKRVMRRNVCKYLDIFYFFGLYINAFGIDENCIKYFFFLSFLHS